jgi:alkylation response protein AidB-like acyl-CoA dehydrogenase
MLVLTDDEAMLRDSAKGFLAEAAPVAQLRALRDGRDETGFSRELWRSIAEMGWTGVLVPEEHGGLAFGNVGAALICEEMGRTLTASPFLSTAVMAATALTGGGSEAQKRRWLPAIVAGEAILALAVDEGRKHDPAQTALKAEKSGNGFRLDGTKIFVADGHVADALIVAARTSGEPGERDGLSLFLVDGTAQGLSGERTIMVDSRNAARLTFEGVQVDDADALGEIGRGNDLLERVLDAGRTGLAAELSGVAQESFDRTVSYMKQRQQFGKPIGAFQALQHRAAHLYSEIEVTKSAVLAAAQALDRKPDKAGPNVSLAKAKAAEVARLAVSEAVQIHGGIGMTDEIDIGLFMKRARVAAEMFGDSGFHADRIARLRGF